MRCRVIIRLLPLGRVSFDVAAADLETALNWMVKRIGPSVARELMRRRTRTGSAGASAE
jgi:hypothetical protein